MRHTPSLWTLCALLVATVIVGGCGFALRGSAALPAALQPLALSNVDNATPLGQELLRALASNDVDLATEAGSASYQLEVGGEAFAERALSVNANARAGEYELTISVPWQLRRGTTVVLGPETLSLGKVYLADPENAIAKQEEAELIRAEMRRELALQLLRRLQVFVP
ncbi:MAG: LPS assembly lipoprotein LptE [Pseudohongiellaceae bacterium]|jgi:LPS-assembly lipoprotein